MRFLNSAAVNGVRLINLHAARLLVAITVVLVQPGCTSKTKRVGSPEATFLVQRIDAIAGTTLVIPLEDRSDLDMKVVPRVRLDDGRTLEAHWYRVIVTMPRDSDLAPGQGEWLPAPGVWSTYQLDDAGDFRERAVRNVGTRVMTVRLPTDASGQSLWVGQRRIPVRWLPALTSVLAQGEKGPFQPILTDNASRLALLPLIRAESLTPIGRWRFRMLTDGLSPTAAAGVGLTPVFDDPVIEAIAKQNEARWRIALALLWRSDADLAMRLMRRLTMIVDFAGVAAPAWPMDQRMLDSLLSDLLDPHSPPEQLAVKVEDWIESQPRAAAWVDDDAGTEDVATSHPIGSIAVCNLSDRATLAWIGSPHERAGANLIPLPMGETRILTVRGEGTSSSDLIANAGKWNRRLTIAACHAPVTPPGLQIGPLFPDFTLSSWTQAATDSGSSGRWPTTRPEWATHAILQQRNEPGSSWELYVECRGSTPPIAGLPSSEESVRIWLGARGSPISVLRVTSDGRVSDEAIRTDLAPTPADVRVARTAGSWSFRIPIPARAIGANGVLRIALTRTDSMKRRSSWPRPMLPWQAEPGRAGLDLRAWDGLSRTHDGGG